MEYLSAVGDKLSDSLGKFVSHKVIGIEGFLDGVREIGLVIAALIKLVGVPVNVRGRRRRQTDVESVKILGSKFADNYIYSTRRLLSFLRAQVAKPDSLTIYFITGSNRASHFENSLGTFRSGFCVKIAYVDSGSAHDRFICSDQFSFTMGRGMDFLIEAQNVNADTYGKNIEEAPIQFASEFDLLTSKVGQHPRLQGVENIKMELTLQMPTSEEMLASIFDDKKVDESHELIPRPSRLSIDVNHLPFWGITRKRDGSYGTSVINVEHPVFQSLVDALQENLVWNSDKLASTTNLVRGFLEQCFLDEYIHWHGSDLPFTRPEKSFLSVKRTAFAYMQKLRSQGIDSPIDFVEDSETIADKLDDFSHLLFDRIDANLYHRFTNFTYLGPIREIPDRFFAFLNRHESNWQASGGEAWDILRQDKVCIDAVNQWLRNEKFLKTPYQIRKRIFLSTDSLREPINRACNEWNNVLEGEREEDLASLNEKINSFGALDNDEFTDDLIKDIEDNGEPPRFEDLILFDLKKRITVGHRDVGVGISQLLPVLVYAMAYKQKTIAIEQPEIPP
jgi:hypothetical protein